MKVRYIENKKDDVQGASLQNKLVGLKYLGENSRSETLLGAIEEKVFNRNEMIPNDYTSITYDHAKSLCDEEGGLIVKLRRKFKDRYIFGLADSYHELNIAVTHAIKDLSEDIKEVFD